MGNALYCRDFRSYPDLENLSAIAYSDKENETITREALMNRIAGLERKLKRVMREVNNIQKELTLAKAAARKRTQGARHVTERWEALARKVSAKWKGPQDAVAEIRWHREKP